ncbi:MAG: hypothetical protein HC859_10780 [Bacteroidia bacterium]|nr:hypothetical protein [Bacteroidia bacterium]
MKVNEDDIDKSTYTGRLALENFDLGTYFEDSVLFQKVNLDGQVRGSGLTLNTANFNLDGVVSRLGIYGYDYTNIRTNARFAASFSTAACQSTTPTWSLPPRAL